MNTPIPLLSSVLLLAAVIGLVWQHLLVSKVRKTFPKKWDCLDDSCAGFVTDQRFIWLKRYRAFGDERIVRQAVRLRNYWVAFFAFFLLAMVLVFVDIGSR